ncbi:MAG: hypothetical protein WBN68_02055 [Sedimenticolaceae bacterium]
MIQQTSPHPPYAYRIDVQGDLAPWEGRLGGLQMSSRHDLRYGRVTSLSGPVQDQAELFGILNTLYELHLPLLRLSSLPSQITDEDNNIKS